MGYFPPLSLSSTTHVPCHSEYLRWSLIPNRFTKFKTNKPISSKARRLIPRTKLNAGRPGHFHKRNLGKKRIQTTLAQLVIESHQSSIVRVIPLLKIVLAIYQTQWSTKHIRPRRITSEKTSTLVSDRSIYKTGQLTVHMSLSCPHV